MSLAGLEPIGRGDEGTRRGVASAVIDDTTTAVGNIGSHTSYLLIDLFTDMAILRAVKYILEDGSEPATRDNSLRQVLARLREYQYIGDSHIIEEILLEYIASSIPEAVKTYFGLPERVMDEWDLESLVARVLFEIRLRINSNSAIDPVRGFRNLTMRTIKRLLERYPECGGLSEEDWRSLRLALSMHRTGKSRARRLKTVLECLGERLARELRERERTVA